MGERLPCALLEACVVLGASGRRLREHAGQDHQDELTPLILDVLTPPCPGELRDGAAPTTASSSTASTSSSSSSSSGEEVPGLQGSVELGLSSTLDHADGSWELELDGLPQLCFPGEGRQVTDAISPALVSSRRGNASGLPSRLGRRGGSEMLTTSPGVQQVVGSIPTLTMPVVYLAFARLSRSPWSCGLLSASSGFSLHIHNRNVISSIRLL
ncbi:uncharacterized protein LOC144931361 [Lampetra fluviatilis]